MAEAAVIWSADFENFPSGHHYGAVTAFAIRRLKATVEELVSVQHNWDDATSPTMSHKAGLCTVCGLSDGSPADLYDVNGALWFDYTNGSLLRDFGGGVGVTSIGGSDHSILLNRDDNSAHTQYILLAGDTEIADLSTPEIEGLSESSASYTSNDMIVSRVVHLTTPADHTGVITDNAGVSYGYDKLNIGAETTLYDSVTDQPINTKVDVEIGRYALMPRLHSDTTASVTFTMLPGFNATPPDDWSAHLTFIWGGTARLKVVGRNIT